MASKIVYDRIFSGIQPSGRAHLGNYLGALRQWVRLQDKARQNFYSIVDLHALTVPQDPAALRANVHDLACVLLACGVNPEKSVIFPQSKVLEHTNLAWIFMCNTTLGPMKNMPHLKEKGFSKNPGMGIVSYPLLQAADILLYDSTHVPVGEDQVPHLHLARSVALSFNHQYQKKVFTEPETILEKTACRVRDLKHPLKKMSKSTKRDNACLYLDDTDDEMIEKIKGATTDSLGLRMSFDPVERPGISSLITLHSAFSGLSIDDVVAKYDGVYTTTFKADIGELLVEHLGPVRTKLLQLREDREYVDNILEEGTKQAQQIAVAKWKTVREVIGLL